MRKNKWVVTVLFLLLLTGESEPVFAVNSVVFRAASTSPIWGCDHIIGVDKQK